ncbi:MAG: hypothetical protein ACPL3E_02450 [Minisyncoccia bacterium]
MENLKNLSKEVCAQFPELKNKEKLKVLVNLGAFHTGVFHLLKKEKIPAQATFIKKPYLFSRAGEMTRKERFFPREIILMNLLPKVLLEIFYLHILIIFQKIQL